MSIHLTRQLDLIKKGILNLGAMVEESLKLSIKAVLERDSELAKVIKERDREIDLAEIDLEEECLKALALHQPVATDLRFIIAVLKMNHDLERIGDLAVDMAKEGVELSNLPVMELSGFELGAMSQQAQAMLKRSLDALVRFDPALAQAVRDQDDEVDAMDGQIFAQAEQAGKGEPDLFPQLVCVLNVSRSLERIADHAVNIAKDVIYMVQGDIVRHSRKQPHTAGS